MNKMGKKVEEKRRVSLRFRISHNMELGEVETIAR
jgi:hypothetical protein